MEPESLSRSRGKLRCNACLHAWRALGGALMGSIPRFACIGRLADIQSADACKERPRARRAASVACGCVPCPACACGICKVHRHRQRGIIVDDVQLGCSFTAVHGPQGCQQAIWQTLCSPAVVVVAHVDSTPAQAASSAARKPLNAEEEHRGYTEAQLNALLNSPSKLHGKATKQAMLPLQMWCGINTWCTPAPRHGPRML